MAKPTEYKIKISGSGTTGELLQALERIKNNIEEAVSSGHELQLLDGAEWEDSTLYTNVDAE